MIQYQILASGSSGNSVVIDDIMIDCGIAYNKLKDYLYNIKYLLLTHNHSDHIKPSCYTRIRKEFPHIITIGNYEVAQKHCVDIISNSGFEVVTEGYSFLPFDCEHDVVTQGFTWNKGDTNIIYATDTASLEQAPVDKYDYLFLESNHDHKKLELVRAETKGKYKPYLEAKRHLSTQDCRTFYYLHRRSKDSELIELHKSSRFY